MRTTFEIPKLSRAERDRRWALVRGAMQRAGLDALVLSGWPLQWDFNTANARYLCPIGGNAEFNILVFPLQGEPTCFVSQATMLPYWALTQDWVADVRVRKGTWADSIAGRVAELGLQRGRLGLDGLAGPLDADGWLPHSMYLRMQELMPDAALVNIDDMLETLRAVKSGEEIAALEQAARIGDCMLAACRDAARPGVAEAAVYGSIQQAMMANGGEEPTLLLWAADANPPPHPHRVPTMRPLAKGDIITCEMHPKYGGYMTHVERTFSLGAAEPDRLRIYDGCLAAYEAGLAMVGPGRSISAALEATRAAIAARGLGICEAGFHGHGLGSLEYPRYRLHALKADQKALQVVGDRFEAGMVFAFNIDLFDPAWRGGETGCVFAETVLVDETGARRMHSYPLELQVLPV